jgi:two-component system response regulator
MRSSKYTILLIEDDVDDAEMTIYTLRKLNHLEIIHIDDGVQAMQYLFEDHLPQPSLILLDVRMPKVDGIQILKRLKADLEKRKIPVALMISSVEGKHYVRSFDISPDAYITKPVDCRSLLQVMAETGFKNGAFGHSDVLNSGRLIWPNIGDW